MKTKGALSVLLLWSLASCVIAQPDASNESRIYRSVESEDNVEYPELHVANSRFAGLLAVIEFLRSEGLTMGPPIPIKYGDNPAWEIGFYDVETEKLRFLYIVEASTGFVHLVCDKAETPDCG